MRPDPNLLTRATPGPLALCLLLFTLAAGCSDPVLVFDEAGPLGGAPRRYALGSVLELEVRTSSGDVLLVAGDASVMSADVERAGRYRLEALAEGETVLRVVERSDPAHVLAEHAVVVVRPTSARILARAEHALAEPGASHDVLAVSDGELRVRVELSADGAPLVGQGDIDLIATPALVLEGDEGTRQVLILPGVTHVEVEAFTATGQLLGTRGIELLEPAVVDSIELTEGVSRLEFDGETRVAVARARDAGGRPLLGARYEWTIDGVRSARFDDVHPIPPGVRRIEVAVSYRGRSASMTLGE